ncbi:MAG: ABC transporter ATP-binding protein, partial [Gammaproteobacteria bacterium]|nr:ABC transporter ATP-binding protein [Gammaproteobacteria bacterium]
MPEVNVDIQFERKDFKLEACFDLNAGGEVTVILGRSGSGKSTLLRLLAGLESPVAGKIISDGVPWFDAALKINKKPQARANGFMFQDYALFENMTVAENIGFGVTRDKRACIVDDLLQKLNLLDYMNMYPSQLSGGQKQRVALGRALAIKPDLLLLDEPLSAIDFHLRKHLQKELKRYINAQSCPVILVTHDLQEARFMADKLIVMANGKIARQGDAKVVFENPVNKDAAMTLGWQNFIPIKELSKGHVQTRWGSFNLNARYIPNAKWLAIRPELIHFSKPQENTLAASVVEIFDMGSYREIECSVGDEHNIVVHRPIHEPSPLLGDKVNLHLSADHLRYINDSYRVPSCFDSQLTAEEKERLIAR